MDGASLQPYGPALVEIAAADVGNWESTDGALVLARALAQRLARLRSQVDHSTELRVARALALDVIDLLEAHAATGTIRL